MEESTVKSIDQLYNLMLECTRLFVQIFHERFMQRPSSLYFNEFTGHYLVNAKYHHSWRLELIHIGDHFYLVLIIKVVTDDDFLSTLIYGSLYSMNVYGVPLFRNMQAKIIHLVF